MAKIIINRKASFQQRMKRFDVYLDGEKRGSITSGGSEEFEVVPGTHTVRCKASWLGSNEYEVSVKENDIKFLEVQPNLPFFWLVYVVLLVALAVPLVFMFLGREIPLESYRLFRNIVIGLVVLYYVVFLVIRRDRSLKIGEDRKNIFNS